MWRTSTRALDRSSNGTFCALLAHSPALHWIDSRDYFFPHYSASSPTEHERSQLTRSQLQGRQQILVLVLVPLLRHKVELCFFFIVLSCSLLRPFAFSPLYYSSSQQTMTEWAEICGARFFFVLLFLYHPLVLTRLDPPGEPICTNDFVFFDLFFISGGTRIEREIQRNDESRPVKCVSSVFVSISIRFELIIYRDILFSTHTSIMQIGGFELRISCGRREVKLHAVKFLRWEKALYIFIRWNIDGTSILKNNFYPRINRKWILARENELDPSREISLRASTNVFNCCDG